MKLFVVKFKDGSSDRIVADTIREAEKSAFEIAKHAQTSVLEIIDVAANANKEEQQEPGSFLTFTEEGAQIKRIIVASKDLGIKGMLLDHKYLWDTIETGEYTDKDHDEVMDEIVITYTVVYEDYDYVDMKKLWNVNKAITNLCNIQTASQKGNKIIDELLRKAHDKAINILENEGKFTEEDEVVPESAPQAEKEI